MSRCALCGAPVPWCMRADCPGAPKHEPDTVTVPREVLMRVRACLLDLTFMEDGRRRISYKGEWDVTEEVQPILDALAPYLEASDE